MCLVDVCVVSLELTPFFSGSLQVLTSLSAEDPTRLNFPLTDGLYVPYLTSCGLFVVTYTASLALARVLTRRRIDWHAAWTGHGATGGLIWAVFATVVLVALFVALCGGLAVAWSIRDATPVTIAGDGIDCHRQDSARCGSYYCDSANDQCYTSCETDDHCRTGALCALVGGYCECLKFCLACSGVPLGLVSSPPLLPPPSCLPLSTRAL